MIAIFLDRDGVINKYPGDTAYVTTWKAFKFLPRVKRAIALLNKEKFPIFVISNQAGVGKGVYSRQTLKIITKNMIKELAGFGAKIDDVYYCMHTDKDNCVCRKPKIGLIKFAVRGRRINIRDSFFIGDTIRDVHTAKAAGCKSILVLSGKEKLSEKNKWEIMPDFVFRDLYEAVRFILS